MGMVSPTELMSILFLLHALHSNKRGFKFIITGQLFKSTVEVLVATKQQTEGVGPTKSLLYINNKAWADGIAVGPLLKIRL